MRSAARAERAGTGPSAGTLRIGGLVPLTSIDFPGRLAAVLFCQGCPWQCGYCHNPHLIPPQVPPAMAWDDFLSFLARRRGLLDGVVFSGGEPTLQAALPEAMGAVRRMGFQIALHTAGMYPDRLASVLPLVDWVGFDIKGPAHCHEAITGTPGGAARAMASLDRLLASGVPYECRTTWDPGLFDEAALMALADGLTARGVRHWSLQVCNRAGRPVPWPPGVAGRLASAFPQLALRAVAGLA